MSEQRRAAYRRLLRWYPRLWRAANEAVMLDTLEQHADATGTEKPRPGETWSLRAHGLAERATPRAIMIVAAASVVLALAPLVLVLTGATAAWTPTASVSAQFAGALLVSLVAGALLLSAGVTSAESALVAALCAVPAWVFGGLASASWSVGFAEADDGLARTWFGSATPQLLLAAVAFGTAAMLPVAVSLLRGVRSAFVRWPLAMMLSAVAALIVGFTAAIPTGILPIAVTLLVVAGLQQRRENDPAHETGSPPVTVAPLSTSMRRKVAVASLGAAVLGLGAVVFSLTGSVWVPAVGDSTQAMRVGIFAGLLIGIATVTTGAIALQSRLCRSMVRPAAALVGALVVGAASYALPIDSPFGWPLLLVAALLLGLGIGFLCAPTLPNGMALRLTLVTAIALATTASIGVIAITSAAFIAPVLAAVTAIALVRRPRPAFRRIVA